MSSASRKRSVAAACAACSVVVLAACGPSEPFTVELSSDSMVYAIRDEAIITIDPTAYDDAPIERFDIVLYRQSDPDGSIHEVVHRVVALEGEQFAYNELGEMTISNQPVEEPLTVQQPTGWVGELTIPDGHVFVMGDNRPESIHEDSREFGPITRAAIIGKVVEVDSMDWVGRTGGTRTAVHGCFGGGRFGPCGR